MQIIKSVSLMHKISLEMLTSGIDIGFVPTMGALHEGHISLIRESKKENAKTVVSIFINPKQFNASEDFESYPIELESDIKKLKSLGVQYLFNPSVKEMYPQREFLTDVRVKELDNNLCGAYRKGHFEGVCVICLKLFNIVKPKVAYFGQKDYQQAIIIKTLVKDLNLGLDVRILPIVRDNRGLALSSRNKNLTKKELDLAPIIYKSILAGKKAVKKGIREVDRIKHIVSSTLSSLSTLSSQNIIRIEYISIVSTKDLKEVYDLIESSRILIAVAVYIGNTRLIDNEIVDIVDID